MSERQQQLEVLRQSNRKALGFTMGFTTTAAGTCDYMISKQSGWVWCGKPAVNGKPRCEDHGRAFFG